jgi:hypothetical protein
MKLMVSTLMEVSKVPAVSKASDKIWANPPAGVKVLAGYTCQGLAFPDMPTNTILSIRLVEAESNEDVAAIIYPLAVAGATVWSTPILDLPQGGVVDMEKKYRG